MQGWNVVGQEGGGSSDQSQLFRAQSTGRIWVGGGKTADVPQSHPTSQGEGISYSSLPGTPVWAGTLRAVMRKREAAACQYWR